MKQVKIRKTKDTLYYEKLGNGLQIFMIPKDDINTTVVSFNTKYGSIYNEFVPVKEKKMKAFPNGIAHFLEHKMFEQENGIEPMKFYAENGADVNAYTTFYNTAYYFSCSSNLKKNINYLLDFVQSPYITDENVEQEKGIIEEEIMMYNDDPYSYMGDKIRFNAFDKHPVKHPVAGDVGTVRSITKEQLITCYTTFYNPNNMFLVITGKFEVEDIISVIKENQQKKEFAKIDLITIKHIKEKNSVVKEYEEQERDVEVPKISYGIKLPIKNIKINPKKRDYYLAIILDSIFGTTSLFNEEMKNKGYLLSNIMIDVLYTEKHLFIVINADTEYPSELLLAIKRQLDDIQIANEDFENKKRMLISNEIYIYEDAESINRHLVNDLILYGEYNSNVDKLVKELNKDELKDLISKLNIKNTTTLVIKPKSK